MILGIRQIRNLSGTLGSVAELAEAVGFALDSAHDTVSHWIMLERRESEVGFVDTDGPILTAFAHSLVSRPVTDEIPAVKWMTTNHIARLNGILNDLAALDSAAAARSTLLVDPSADD